MGQQSTMVGRSATILLLALALAAPADSAHPLVRLTGVLNQKIDFVGHDNGLRSHITALENDFKELDNLDNEAWQHGHVQKLLTSLTEAVNMLRRVEDHIISLARTSRTDVSGLETHLNQFKRQVDRRLPTDNTYGAIMALVRKLIGASMDKMEEEIDDINEAESKLNRATAEMDALQGLLKVHEKHEDEVETAAETGVIVSLLATALVSFFDTEKADEIALVGLEKLEKLGAVWEHREKFDRVESNIRSSFQYFRREVELVKKEETEIRYLRDDFDKIGASWKDLQDELQDVAEDGDDWDEDVMADVKILKKSINKFVDSAGHW